MTTPSPAPVSVTSTAITPTGPPATAPAAVSPTVDAGVPVQRPTPVPLSQIDVAPAAVSLGPGTGTTVPPGTVFVPIDQTPISVVVPPPPGTVTVGFAKPSGPQGAIQFNNNNNFGGNANLSYSQGGLFVGGVSTTGNASGIITARTDFRSGSWKPVKFDFEDDVFSRFRQQEVGTDPDATFYGWNWDYQQSLQQATVITNEAWMTSAATLFEAAAYNTSNEKIPATVFGISVNNGYADFKPSTGTEPNWHKLMEVTNWGDLGIGGNITINPSWQYIATQPANNQVGIKFADGTFQYTAAGAGSSTIIIQDEGSNVLASGANTINFVGAGVTASNVSGVATITIPSQVGGTNTQLQFNDNGVFGGIPTATYSNGSLNLGNVTTTSSTANAVTANTVTANTVAANAVTANAITATGPANLGNVGNVKIAGGAAGQVLTTDGTGNLSWTPSSSSNITIKDEGSDVVSSANTINFVGAGVTASNVSGVATITISGGGSGVTVQEESSTVLATATTLNFLGNGVTASNIAGVAIITVPGGITVNDEQSFVIQTDTISFNGPLVAATNSLNVQADIQVGLTVQDEGNVIAGNAAIGTLNFLGAGVTVTSGPTGIANVTISGSTATSVASGNVTLGSGLGGSIIKWANGDIVITAPSTANGATPVGTTFQIFNASQSGNANIFADFGNAVLVGPRPNAEGILSYVQVGPFEQVTVVNLGPSAGNVSSGTTMWFCYGSAYPLGIAYN